MKNASSTPSCYDGRRMNVLRTALGTIFVFAGPATALAQGGGARTVSPDAVFNRPVQSSCSGSACSEVSMERRGGCVWVKNGSKLPVNFEALVEGQPIKLLLEAPDEKKGAERRAAHEKAGADQQALQQSNSAREDCEKRRLFDKAREERAVPGAGKFLTPEEARAKEICRVLLSAPTSQTAPTEITSYHEQVYHAFNQSYRGAVFWAKLKAGNDCIGDVRSVTTYSATLVGAPAVAPVQMPCQGNACADIAFESAKCELRNVGNKTVSIKVVAKEFGATVSMPALEPGKAIPVTTMVGCIRPEAMARSEVNYR